ncbi:sugar kinase [Pseudocolwellia sp. HL-MZ19]|uniref:sugar kinase n=1 Tax=unclassified Pseudocolwellia TaxID=2848178 RepID=UPI003CF9F206
MKNIFLFGECMVELLNVSPNAQLPQTLKQSFAGDVFNTAVYLKRVFADMKVNIVTAVGTDEFSSNMVEYFQQQNIETDFVYRSTDKIAGLYSIKTDSEGERTFTYWRENSAARQVMKSIDSAEIEKMSQGDVFFFSGISLAVITPEDRPKFWEMVEQLKSAGVTIIFDPNYRARMWSSPDEAKQEYHQAFTLSNIALPGVDDFKQLYQLNTAEEVITFSEAYTFDELVIKNGEKGVVYIKDNTRTDIAITPVENVVDTTSAGDSFNGVFVGARTAGTNSNDAIKLASASAALVIQHKGAIVEQDVFQAFIDNDLYRLN